MDQPPIPSLLLKGGPLPTMYSGFRADQLEITENDLVPDEEMEQEWHAIDEKAESMIDHLAGAVPWSTILICTNLPVVSAEKLEKLAGVVKKIFKPFGRGVADVAMPMGPSGTKGFAFLHFYNHHDAQQALKQANNYKLDKNHVIKLFTFDFVDALVKMSDEPPVVPKTEYREGEHLKEWLLDSRDQFIVIKGEEVVVYWNNKLEMPSVVFDKSNWTESVVQFSPLGNYLATFHRQGIALWGGQSWKRLMKFAHPNVRLIDFSPCEMYVTTWSIEPVQWEDEWVNLFVWDVATGKPLRGFLMESKQTAPTGFVPPTRTGQALQGLIQWPVFQWSHDDKYLLKFTTGDAGAIQIYTTPDLALLDKKSIKVEGLMDVAVSKGSEESYLSYWTPEHDNTPARVVVLKMNKEQVRVKNLFGVAEMHWHPSTSNYLAIHVLRHTKTKKSTYSSFEVFRLKDKDVPIDVVELKQTETVQCFAWEPLDKRPRWCVVTLAGTGSIAKSPISLYELPNDDDFTATRLVKSLDKRNVTGIFWNPKGRFLISRMTDGVLEFLDMDEGVTMGTVEHYGATQVEWDPSGRFAASCVTGWKSGMDPGYHIYTMTGQLLHRIPMPGLKMFGWRPRPATLLSPDQQKQIRKNWKEYTKEFDELDSKFSSSVAKETSEKRQRLWQEYMAWKQSAHTRWLETRPMRVELVGEESKDVEEVEELHEEVIEETIVPSPDEPTDQALDDEAVEEMVDAEIEAVEHVLESTLEHNRHGGKHDHELLQI